MVALSSLMAAGQAWSMGLDFGGGGSTDTGGRDFTSTVIDTWGGVQRPSRMALSDGGLVYVSDLPRGLVVTYDVAGERVGTITGVAEPLGVAVAQVTVTTITDACDDSRPDVRPAWARRPRPHASSVWRGRPGGPSGGDSSDCEDVVDIVSTTVDHVYVGDQSDGSVRIFEDGVEVGNLGSGAGEFSKPNAIEVTWDQTAWVVDSGVDQILAYNADGDLVLTLGASGSGDGELDFPTDLIVDADLGEVYVADFGNRRIAVFDTSGTWLRNLDPPMNSMDEPSFYRIAGLGRVPDGSLLVVDSSLGAVTLMDTDGVLQGIIGYQLDSFGTGELSVPIDAVSDGAYVYVSSSRDGSIKLFEVPE
ncbi:MAG: hypothetical protein GXP62_02700 [Oligoflexia bacterium]|nr:hypothetical protein [Oligoflexia bacterium]